MERMREELAELRDLKDQGLLPPQVCLRTLSYTLKRSMLSCVV